MSPRRAPRRERVMRLQRWRVLAEYRYFQLSKTPHIAYFDSLFTTTISLCSIRKQLSILIGLETFIGTTTTAFHLNHGGFDHGHRRTRTEGCDQVFYCGAGGEAAVASVGIEAALWPHLYSTYNDFGASEMGMETIKGTSRFKTDYKRCRITIWWLTVRWAQPSTSKSACCTTRWNT